MGDADSLRSLMLWMLKLLLLEEVVEGGERFSRFVHRFEGTIAGFGKFGNAGVLHSLMFWMLLWVIPIQKKTNEQMPISLKKI